MNNFNIRQFKHDDTNQLETFYYQAFGERARYKFPERWYWLFKDNPWAKCWCPNINIAELEGEIIGHSAAYIVKCKVFENTVDLAWGIDAIILSPYRGRGIGTELQKKNLADHVFYASLNMSDSINHIRKKIGGTQGPSANIYVKLLNLQSAYNYRDKALYGIILYPVMAMLHILIKIIQFVKRKKSQISLMNISQPLPAKFGQEESRLWEAIRDQYDFAVERNSDYLNWRYEKQPWTQHFCCRAYDNLNVLIGFVVYRLAEETNPKSGVILDLIGQHSKIIASLLVAAEQHLIKLGAVQIQVASSDQKIHVTVMSSGYIKIDEKRLVVHGPEEIIKRFQSQLNALISKGDQDWDQFPRAKIYTPVHIVMNYLKSLAVNLFRWVF